MRLGHCLSTQGQGAAGRPGLNPAGWRARQLPEAVISAEAWDPLPVPGPSMGPRHLPQSHPGFGANGDHGPQSPDRLVLVWEASYQVPPVGGAPGGTGTRRRRPDGPE